MDIKFVFAVTATILASVCYIPYILDIFKKQTHPHIYSWLVWALVQSIGVVAQIKDGAGFGAWPLAIGATCCWIVFFLSFRYGTKNITSFDGVCLFASLGTLVFYVTSDDAVTAVILISFIDFFGFLPTFRKAFHAPWSETASVYAITTLFTILSLFALENYTVVTVAYVGSILFTNAAFTLLLFVRRRRIAPPLIRA